MYKLLIVEDELNNNKKIIDEPAWNKLGFTIIGIVENGLAALELIEENVPDVVITDIAMPLMDGLELTKELHSKFDMVKVVILTGYDQFDYAHTAANLKVEAFLLKPVQLTDLEAIMTRIKLSLDEEHESKMDIERLRQLYKESLPVLRARTLENLIYGKLKKDEIENSLSEFSFTLTGKNFLVCIISPDSKIHANSYKRKNGTSDMLSYIINNIVHDIMIEKFHIGEAFEYHGDFIVICSFDRTNIDAIHQRINTVCTELLIHVHKFIDIPLTIGIGTIVDSLELLSDSYHDAKLALDYRLLLGGDRLIFIDDLEKRQHNHLFFSETDHAELMKNIRLCERANNTLIISELFERISQNNVEWYDCQVFIVNMLNVLFSISHDFDIDCMKIWDPQWKQLMHIRDFNSLGELKNTYTVCCEALMDQIDQLRVKNNTNFAEKAIEYINCFYGDAAFDINKAAGMLHISSGYLNNIIRKQLGSTFHAILMEVRMDKAKELLRNSTLMIYEISEKVGFKEQYYFSYCFKKNTGHSPRQYRNAAH